MKLRLLLKRFLAWIRAGLNRMRIWAASSECTEDEGLFVAITLDDEDEERE